MKEEIKSLRVRIDGYAQLAKELRPIIMGESAMSLVTSLYPKIDVSKGMVSSYEIVRAEESLYMSKAWLGKLLGELGTENPYGSGYKRKEDIVPTQDVSMVASVINKFPEITNTINGFNWAESNHIERVDWLRTEIEKLTFSVVNLPYNDPITLAFVIMNNAYTQLCEARFWLGFELQRIKEAA